MPVRILFFSVMLLAAQVEAVPCGDYLIRGVVRYQGSRAELVVAEGSKSEMHFRAPEKGAAALLGFRNRMIQCVGTVAKAMNGTSGELTKVDLVRPVLGSIFPSAAQDNFSLRKEQKCAP